MLFLAVCLVAFLPILWLIIYLEERAWTWTKSSQAQSYQQEVNSELAALKDIEQRQRLADNEEQRRIYADAQRARAEEIQRRPRR